MLVNTYKKNQRVLTEVMVLLNSKNVNLNALSSQRGSSINSRVSPWLAALAYPLGSRIVLPTYFSNLSIVGQENIPSEGPVILAPTHRSRWDALVVPHVSGRRVTGRYLRFMVTSDEVIGLQGWVIRRLGGFPVNPRQPGITSLRYGLELVLAGEMLVIFPEGGIFQDGQLHPLKPGLARLAVQAESAQPGLGLKVVPIHLQYSELVPQWGCSIHVRIGAPLDVAVYLRQSPKADAKRLTGDLQTSLERLQAAAALDSTLSAYGSKQ